MYNDVIILEQNGGGALMEEQSMLWGEEGRDVEIFIWDGGEVEGCIDFSFCKPF